MRKINTLSQNSQHRRSGENSNRLFETYKKYVMPHGRHIYPKISDMAMAKMCAYSTSQHSFPCWKCVLSCCSNLPRIDIPYQESDRHNSNVSPSIYFHIYNLIEKFTVYGRRPQYEKKKIVCVFKIRILWHLKNYTS